jgi:hypothetical protein
MPPKKAAESKQGLVITLVFFILLTLGLGVATYYGFAEQEQLTKAAKEAKDKEKLFTDERDYYRAQANLFRVMMGHPRQSDFDENQLAQGKDGIEKGTLGKSVKAQEDVKKLVADLEKKHGWDAAGKKPKTSYEELLAKANRDYEALHANNLALAKKAADAEEKQKEAERKQVEAAKNFEKELLAIGQKAKDDLEGQRKTIEELRNEIGKLGEAKEQVAKKAAEDVDLEKKKAAKKDLEIKQLKALVTARNEELAQYKKPVETQAAMRTDWQIVRMDPRGTMPYINLGSSDKVRPQLTFSIHGMAPDGRPDPASKGTLEVVNVLGEHLSQARITSVKDPHRDPIVKGDMLHNPLWNPNLKKHVAIAGVVDLSGGSREPGAGMDDFLRSLERQNVIVDAWMDPKDNFKIKGPGINVSTDYLILAETLEAVGDGRERNVEMGRAIDKAVTDMKEQAAKNGVAVLGLRKYLEMIGYRLPPHLAEPTGISPLYKPRPDQAERVPVDRQPMEKR